MLSTSLDVFELADEGDHRHRHRLPRGSRRYAPGHGCRLDGSNRRHAFDAGRRQLHPYDAGRLARRICSAYLFDPVFPKQLRRSGTAHAVAQVWQRSALNLQPVGDCLQWFHARNKEIVTAAGDDEARQASHGRDRAGLEKGIVPAALICAGQGQRLRPACPSSSPLLIQLD